MLIVHATTLWLGLSRLAILSAAALVATSCGPTSQSAATGRPTGAADAPSPLRSLSPAPVPTSDGPVSSPDAAPPVGVWLAAGAMVYPRIFFPSAVLADGSLLVVGDDGCGLRIANDGSQRAEVYDPATGRWSEVGSLNKPRGVPDLVSLPDGSAMVLGGVNEQDESFSSTKLYSPANRSWSPGPLMIRAGVLGAVALADGTVIAVTEGDTEILDPDSTAWRRSTPAEIVVRQLVLLADGTVFATGAFDNDDGDPAFATFDPATETWASVAAPYWISPEFVTLDDGSILFFGSDEGGSRVDRYDPATDRWVTRASMRDGRNGAQVTRLADGRVLVAGGMSISSRAVDGGYSVTEDGVTDTTEIYDPASDRWSPGPRLLAPRQAGYATTLTDGSVMVYGGFVKVVEEPGQDTGSTDCPPPIAETERLYVVP